MEYADRPAYLRQITVMAQNTDILMAVAVVVILVVMVVPLPPLMLDLLLSFNITFSLIILLVGMYIMRPLDLSSFPSILLLVTLFRLSLNIASTRLILLNGNEGTMAAGSVIHAFGNFVVGGNYLVGVIVFIILVVINFMVITKGAGRIAEVAARFTLDAMPGKQMSIDADLNAGLIDESEAKNRRLEITREAEYYGAMDGANKFVRGDAIAGIIITLVNIAGGLTVGVLQNQMSFGEAAQTYTLLTVGDGLVSQVPALIVSTAAGIIVSRAGAEASMGTEIGSQLLRQPRAIGIAAVVLFGFAMVPGLPAIPFVALSMLTGFVAYSIHQYRKASQADEEAKALALTESQEQPVGTLEAPPPLDLLALEVGYGLVPLVDVNQDGELLERIRSIRQQMAQDIGIIVPSIHIQDNMQLKPGEYAILLKGVEIAGGELMMNHLLAMNPGGKIENVEGLPTREPTYGLPAVWIKESDRESVLAKGYTVVDVSTVLTTHLSEVIRRNAYELLGRQEVQRLLDTVKETHPKVVDDLVPNMLPLGVVVKVFQNLLREQVPVRDLTTILETLGDWAAHSKDAETLTEYVRQALARAITKHYRLPGGVIPVITLDPGVENMVAESIQHTDAGTFMAMDPGVAQAIMERLSRKIEVFAGRDCQPILLCRPQIRSQFKKLVDRFIPDLVVLSYNDLSTDAQIQSLGIVRLSDAD